MELRREILATIGVLALLNLLLALGSTGLLSRMGPAIERILEDNVYSIVAAEDVLAELAAAPDGEISESGRERVRDALERARENVTEDEEWPALEAIESGLPTAFTGATEARGAVVEELRRLIAINRAAVERVDARARRMGSAGAWAAVLAGFVSVVASVLVVARVHSRFTRPLADLHEVLEAVRRGDRYRRCRSSDAPYELVRVTELVNGLLDDLAEPAEPSSADG